MIKIFLVEDEVIIRQGIKENIPWESHGFEFVGEASDGELAYPMIKKFQPDIVITDIKMQFMDGLELSTIIKKVLPDTKIIILSGYGEFDYAKKAIGIGVTDYLLKPISSVKLLEAVERVAGLIRTEREKEELLRKYEKETAERFKLEWRRLFMGIVDQMLTSRQILERAGELGIDFNAVCYNVLLIKLMTDKGSYENMPEYSEELIRITEETENHINGIADVISISREAEGWILVLKAEEEQGICALENQVHDNIRKITGESKNIGYFIGVGKTAARITELAESYREAGKAFASRFFKEPNQMVYYSEVEQPDECESEDIILRMAGTARIDRNLITRFLTSGTMEETENFVEGLFRDVGEEQYKSQILRQYIVVDMYFSVVGFLEKLGESAEAIEDEYGDVKEMAAQLDTVENMKVYLLGMLSEAIRIRDTEAANQYTILLRKAKEYIKQNFQNKEISLNSVAAHVNISPSYFSTLFRQETGQTFIEYLTGLRLDKAKEYLMCTSMNTTEIGCEVGYGGSHYFSYIFKKTQNCTPKEYRMRKKV